MNALGRQRSGAPAAHHQRQYSDNFLESSSNGRWLQSAGLQHLQSSNNAIPPVQDFGYYNGGGQGSKMYKSFQAQRTYSGGSDLFAEPLTPPGTRRKNGEEQVSPNECSPGLLNREERVFEREILGKGSSWSSPSRHPASRRRRASTGIFCTARRRRRWFFQKGKN